MLITNLVKNEFRDSYNYAMWFAVERYEMFNENISEEDINKIYNKYDTFPAKLGFFTSGILLVLFEGRIATPLFETWPL